MRAKLADVHVVLDGQALVGGIPTGFGIYAGLVADALNLLTEQEQDFSHAVFKPVPASRPLATVYQRILWEQFVLPVLLSRVEQPSLLHSPCLGPPLFSPLSLVCTIHDLILLDEKIPGFFAREYFQRLIPFGWRRAKLVLTDTEQVRGQVIERLHIPENRVAALPLYSRYEGAEKRQQLPPGPPRFLLVGTVEPRKGFATAVGALARLPHSLRNDVRLTIVGKRTPHTIELLSLASQLGVQENVEFVDYQAKLDELYRQATALVFPSEAEGFGLPPLEAMSLGVPVLLSDIEVLRETYARVRDTENPGMFPVGGESALANLMQQVIEDSSFADGLTRFGELVAAELTRERFAAGLLAAYRRAAQKA